MILYLINIDSFDLFSFHCSKDEDEYVERAKLEIEARARMTKERMTGRVSN